MNIQSLIYQLECINSDHPDKGMRIDVIEKEGRIEELRIEVFSFPNIGVRFPNMPATNVYLLTRVYFDGWQRETIRGG